MTALPDLRRPAGQPAPPLATAPLPAGPARRVPVRRPPVLATSASLLALLLLGFVAHLAGVGAVYHAREQQLGFAQLREDLANAVVPLSAVRDGELVEPGTPVALLEVPSLGLREVVRHGTASGVLASGAGHRRDTVLPGQTGTSVLFGRRAAFGGPFADVPELRRGDLLRVTTGQGVARFRVVGTRRAGDPVPPLPAGGARLTLVTADGPAFLPSGAVRVDADLEGTAFPAPPRGLAAAALPSEEQALAGDGRSAVTVLLLAQALLLAALGVAWARARWGARQAWVVGVPVLSLLGLAVAHAASALLPNLL